MLFKRTHIDKATGRKVKAATWTARYRAADGRMVQKPTGCERKEAAQKKLSDWLALEENIRAGVMTSQEANAATWAHVSIKEHINDFEATMTARNLHKETISRRVYCLNRIFKECKQTRLAEINKARLERWLHDQRNNADMGARTANAYLQSLVAFGSWLVKEGRLTVNPFTGMKKHNEAADRRHVRRAFTQEELSALFEAAAARPLHEAMFRPVRTGVKGKSKIPDKPHDLNEATKEAAQWLGRVRSMAYKTMAYTGLRFGECRSLTIGACHFKSDTPYVDLKAENEKSRRGAQLPLPAFFVPELKQYVHDLKKRLSGDCGAFPGVFNDTPLFDLPEKITKRFNDDLVFAGLAVEVKDKDGNKRIDKSNDRGEVLDIHCLRHTFITHLAQSGASMVTVAKAARHSDPKLTLRVYSHVGLGELGDAVSMLPQPKNCTAAQVANCIPQGGTENVSLKTSPFRGKLGVTTAYYGTLEGGSVEGHKQQKTPINMGFFNGGDDETRTRDLRRDRPDDSNQKSLQTLGETQVSENSVTQNVTFFQKNVTQEVILEALKSLPKEALIELLTEALSQR